MKIVDKYILATFREKQSWIRTFFVILCCVTLFACEEHGKNVANNNDKDWAQEEILQQLSELRREVKILKDEVENLGNQIRAAGNGGLDTNGKFRVVNPSQFVEQGEAFFFATYSFADAQWRSTDYIELYRVVTL